MDSLFLDTSFIIALEDADDQNHQAAASYWKTFKRDGLVKSLKRDFPVIPAKAGIQSF